MKTLVNAGTFAVEVSGIEEEPSIVGDYRVEGSLKVPDDFPHGEDDPMFVTVAIPAGPSRMLGISDSAETDKPHRYWPEKQIDGFVKTVNDSRRIPAYGGHPRDVAALASEHPAPVALWITAAKGIHTQTGKPAALLKGFVYNSNNNRQLIRTGAMNVVSPTTMITSKPGTIEGRRYDIVQESALLSVDFVRNRTEGIRGAAVQSLSSEGASMELTADQIKLITELSVEQLRQYNPVLVEGLAKESAGTSPELLAQLDTQIKSNAQLMVTAAVSTNLASELGCEVAELPKFVTEFKTLRENQVKLATESALTEIKVDGVRELVRKQLSDKKFENAEAAKLAVESAHATTKEILGAAGVQLGAVGGTTKPASGGGFAKSSLASDQVKSWGGN